MIRARTQCWLVSLLLLACLSMPTSAGWPWKGPYLLYGGDTTEMHVIWELRQPLECSIEWGRDEECADGRLDFSEPSVDLIYNALLTDLEPNLKYWYQVSFGTDSISGTFQSAPSGETQGIRFLGWADTQYVSGGDSRSCYGRIAGATLDMLQTDESLQTFLLHAGDWVYSSREDYWDEYFRDWSARRVMSMVPVAGCMGNHDIPFGRYIDGLARYWPYPYAGDHYYSFDYGLVHVVVLDQFSDEMWACQPVESNEQLSWLKTDLRVNTKPWTIILFHVPLLENAEYDSDYREREFADLLIPYFRAGNVDLLLCGHDHAHWFESDGTIPQLCMGSASDMQGDRCFYTFDVTPASIVATAYRSDGSVIETVEVQR